MASGENQERNLVRIMNTDISADSNLLYGLSEIKGISYMFANAVCAALGYDINDRISSLSEKQIEELEDYLSNPVKNGIPSWLTNKQKEYETGEDRHLVSKDIEYDDLQVKRRLNRIKSYRGIRHKAGLTLRGQRTKANFRSNKTLASIKSKSIARRK